MYLDCSPCVAEIKQTTTDILNNLPFVPHLLILSGENAASEVYVRNKRRICEELGIRMTVEKIDEDYSVKEVTHMILRANHDKYINGILLQLPLPKELNFFEYELRNMIAVEKDIDGLTLSPVLAMWNQTPPNFLPCTVEGIYLLLNYYNIDLEGKTVMIIGRSTLLGKPLMLMVLHMNATPIICHTYTRNIDVLGKQADVIISAAGCPGLITEEFIKDNNVLVIDAGTTVVDNQVRGDCSVSVENKCTITPVPGGVGPLTTAVVALHTAQAALQQYIRNQKSKL